MDQALLLGAADSIVGRVEIGHQDSREVLEQSMKQVTLAGFTVDIGHLLQVGKNPHETDLAFDTDLCLVGMEQSTTTQALYECVVADLVCSRCHSLKRSCRSERQMQAEQFVQAADNALRRQPESDVLVERIRYDLSAVFAARPTFLLGWEDSSTHHTFL